jgi:hypothetical protein
VDNPLIDKRKDSVRVPDPVYVGSVPGFKRGGGSCLKFLRSIDLVDGTNLSTDTDASSGKWSVVVLDFNWFLLSFWGQYRVSLDERLKTE